MKYSFPYTEGTYDYFWDNPKMISHVNDIYFSDNAIFPSARHSKLNDANWDELHQTSEKFKIPLNYVINPAVYDADIYYGNKKEEFIGKINDLKEHGIKAITLNNTLLLRDPEIRQALNRYDLKNSVNNMIVTLEQVQQLVDVVGLETVFLGRDINRNLSEIKRIRAKYPSIKIHLLGNEICYPKCIYKKFCDDMITMASQKDDAAFNRLNELRTTLACDQRNFSLYQKLANNFIYPSHIKHLEPYVDVIKISGRLNPIDSISKALEAYVTGDDSFFLNQMNNGLILPSSYYDYTTDCQNKCSTCSLCDVISLDSPAEQVCTSCGGCDKN